ncbi:MAG: hypothetical protein DME70_08300 [Verrucomicrobia bacterium]|nr:MAG: hypothetical protein DME70_08300 [Verrucomicrobiota bacterium]
MPDPVNPTPAATTTTGLPSNVAAALACIPLIGGLVFYILEKHDQFVRFYAMQSIIFGGVWFLFNLASWILHVIFALWLFLSALVHLGFFVLMIIAMVKAFSGVRWDIPYIGPMARKQVGEA